MRLRPVLVVALLIGCRSKPANPYDSASAETVATWKRVRLPLSRGTHFVISQGAFGRASHNQKGIEYRWDFDVPYGTPVLAVAQSFYFSKQ